MTPFETLPLRDLPAAMAAAVIPALERAQLDGYKRFLSAMVHYTRLSGERLSLAADLAPEGPARTLFAELAAEEHGHWRLAEADLAALGAAVEPAPPRGVEAFDAAFRTRGSAFQLGSLYALEQVGGHLGASVRPHLARLGLARDQVRFVVVHLDVDEDHGARAQATCAGWPDAEGILAGARYAAQFWVDLHLDALR